MNEGKLINTYDQISKLTLVNSTAHFALFTNNQVVEAAIYRYKMYSKQNVNTLGGVAQQTSNKKYLIIAKKN